jgi:hypothetical protein
MMSAAPIPSRRALTRWSGGSLFVRIEMKIRLSIPSTTSIAISVTIAAHPSGVVRNAKLSSGTEDLLLRLHRDRHDGRHEAIVDRVQIVDEVMLHGIRVRKERYIELILENMGTYWRVIDHFPQDQLAVRERHSVAYLVTGHVAESVTGAADPP